MPNVVIILICHLYLSGEWLHVDLNMGAKKTCVKKRLEYVLKMC